MSNVRGLYPPLYGAAPSGGGGGGGGGGQHIQVNTLPEASLANKDKIVQYVGATTETLTNAYFYKCVENTGYDWDETEASETYTEAETLPTASAETLGTIYKVGDKYYQTIIVLTYSWDNIDVMSVSSGGRRLLATVTADGDVTYATCLNELADAIENEVTEGKTYILTDHKPVAYGNILFNYRLSQSLPQELVFECQRIIVSGTTVSLTNSHYIVNFNGESKHFADSTNGSNYKPNDGEVFTVYEL